jgi:hypothetical protein
MKTKFPNKSNKKNALRNKNNYLATKERTIQIQENEYQ